MVEEYNNTNDTTTELYFIIYGNSGHIHDTYNEYLEYKKMERGV